MDSPLIFCGSSFCKLRGVWDVSPGWRRGKHVPGRQGNGIQLSVLWGNQLIGLQLCMQMSFMEGVVQLSFIVPCSWIMKVSYLLYPHDMLCIIAAIDHCHGNQLFLIFNSLFTQTSHRFAALYLCVKVCIKFHSHSNRFLWDVYSGTGSNLYTLTRECTEIIV